MVGEFGGAMVKVLIWFLFAEVLLEVFSKILEAGTLESRFSKSSSSLKVLILLCGRRWFENLKQHMVDRKRCWP